MSPLRVNRRRFLGCSAAAGLALAGGQGAEATAIRSPMRLGVIGVGGRGTTLLRGLLELAGVEVVAVADLEPKHRLRAQGIVEKATKARPDAFEDLAGLLRREDLQAVVVALPCDLHAQVLLDAMRAGKHVYIEKPLALGVSECDRVLAESSRRPDLVIHVGHQRRSNPRYVEGARALRNEEFGSLVEARATWTSSNGPMRGCQGWLGRRERSGDWMVEQAVHLWETLHDLTGAVPIRAHGSGRKGLFVGSDPDRDVTDWYTAQLAWESGFQATLTHSWIDPADDGFTGVSLRVLGVNGGFDFGSGVGTFRDRSRPRLTLHPGNLNDTGAALAAFVDAVRRGDGATLPPISLLEAREAVITGLMVRQAVDENRWVTRAETLALAT
jgi:myo-inositol 2-dehydrogenase / D-chiro-inositol 1-dehydrogenase